MRSLLRIPWWVAIALAAAAGLRVASMRDGFWLDEIWAATVA